MSSQVIFMDFRTASTDQPRYVGWRNFEQHDSGNVVIQFEIPRSRDHAVQGSTTLMILARFHNLGGSIYGLRPRTSC